MADDTPDLVQDRGSNDDDEDLFGSDNEDTVQKQKRALDDQELDSGDDLGRDDRVADTVEDAEDQDQDLAAGGRALRLIDCDVPRINYPKGDEFYLLNMPNFLGIKQEAFDPDTYKPQTLPHDGDPSRQTSAYSTAMSSMFWRRDPNDSSSMQSTARFVRWEDGSITLQLATKPMEQYKVNAQPLRQGFGKKVPPGPYEPSKDSLTFLAAAHSTQVVDLQLVRALDASMKILPTGGEQDEAERRLKQLMAATKQEGISLARTKDVEEDPELARKAAEQFEKERMRAQRKRENAEERLTMKRNNVLGRAGLGGGRGGLSVAGLEDEMGMPLSRGKKKQKRKMNRHGEIYSDDEDETMPRGRTREDEYDREDDFLADSDEEPEQYGDDDELLDDEEDDPDRDEVEGQPKKTMLEDRPRKERERTPKRSRMDELDEDEDAEGEPDDELLRQSPQQARKKRRVVEDEDEDE